MAERKAPLPILQVAPDSSTWFSAKGGESVENQDADSSAFAYRPAVHRLGQIAPLALLQFRLSWFELGWFRRGVAGLTLIGAMMAPPASLPAWALSRDEVSRDEVSRDEVSLEAISQPNKSKESTKSSESENASPGEMNEVWEWVRQGDARFDAADFDGAIAAYEKALARLSQAPEWASQSNLVRKLMSDAILGRYRLNEDLADLRRARELLAVYADALPADSSDRAAAQEKVVALDQEIAEASATRAATRASGRTEFHEMNEIQAQRQQAARVLQREHLSVARRFGGWSIGSWALAGVGVVVVGVAVPYSLVRQRDAQRYVDQDYLTDEAHQRAMVQLDSIYDKIDRSRAIAIAGGISAGVFALAGTTLLILRSRSLQKARAINVDVAWRPSGWSFALVGRF